MALTSEATAYTNSSNNNNSNCLRLLAGVWTRLWEEDPLGDVEHADRTTRVWWVQTPSGIYVDLRLPAEPTNQSDHTIQPDPSALSGTSSGLDLNNNNKNTIILKTLASRVMQQKSFAGMLQVSLGDTTDGTALQNDSVLQALASNHNHNIQHAAGSIPLCTCVWRREIDVQPPTGHLDVGVCATAAHTPDGGTDLRETGHDASYAEGWRRRRTTANGPFVAMRLTRENNTTVERRGYWVRAGDHFAYAIGRPTSERAAQALGCVPESDKIHPTNSPSLQETLRKLVNNNNNNNTNNYATATVEQQQLALAWSYVGLVGTIVMQDHGNECWHITASLDPRLVGCTLFGSDPLACSTVVHDSNNSKDNTNGTPQNTLVQTLVADGRTRVWEVVECIGCDLPGM